MSAYAPTGLRIIWILIGALFATLATGFLISRVRARVPARVTAWILVVGAVLFAERATAAEPAGVRMLAVISLLLYAMKAVVSVESPDVRLSPVRWMAFAAAWPGMRPGLFAGTGNPPLEGAGKLLWKGVIRVATGAALIAAAWVLWRATRSQLLATAFLLPGISLVLHFGVFNILAGGWRYLGVDASPLFKAPLRSRSLAEFWGRRWNLAFSEMTALGIYRPISGFAGKPVGLVVAFTASGVLHELAISVPVKAGYGLPLLYFAVHGALMLIERRLEKSGHPISRHVWLGRTWVVFWLVAPLPLLFHPPFLRGVVWPLLGIS